MTDKQVEKIKKMHAKKMSVRDIADVLEISKSAVGRVVTPLNGWEDDDSEEALYGVPVPATAQKEIVQLQNKLAKELNEGNAIEAQKLKATAEVLAGSDKLDARRLYGRKEVFVTKYDRLYQELRDNCRDTTWGAEEITDFIDRAEQLLEKLEKFCEKNGIDEEELAIYCNLERILDWMEPYAEKTERLFGASSVLVDCFSPLVKAMPFRARL
jgi:predicted DNA-binding protein YlxM (UPF0122 family)